MLPVVTYGRKRQLDDYLGEFEQQFVYGAELRKFFRTASATITYAAPVRRDAPPGSWVLHVRLSPRLEERFGISREFLVYCMPVTDLQTRSVTQVKKLVESAENPIESDLAMIVTSDPQAKEKLTDWGVERTTGMIIIPLDRDQLVNSTSGDTASVALEEVISNWISAYNLYDQREPVSGERFFGRSDLLRDLDRKLAGGAGHVGIFGLRRIGKTSVLLELKDRLRRRPNVVPVFIDLEGSPATSHVAYRLGQELVKAISSRSSTSERSIQRTLRLPEKWDDIPPRMLISNIGDNLRDALSSGVLSGSRLVLIFDEAEILLPDTTNPKEYAIDLFRVLRGVAQETQALTLVLAGVNATPAESPTLGNEDNPLFGLLSIEYLGPLTIDECTQMVRRVGRKMQLRWEAPGLMRLASAVGAHPLLARLAASDVATTQTERPLRPNIAQVEAALGDFPQKHSAIFSQMVQSLQRYYPDEFELLKLIAAGEIEFALTFASENATILNHLSGYGVVNEREMEISIPVFARWLRAHQA